MEAAPSLYWGGGMIITIHNAKGGVGKTTTTINLGVNLATAGQRVLIIDGDRQHNATFGLGQDPQPGVYNWIVEGRFEPVSVRPTLDLLPSARKPSWWEQSTLDVVTQRFRELPAYDWIIVDTNPSQSDWVDSVLKISDAILIPVDFGLYAVAGVSELIEDLDSSRIIGLVPVRYDLRNNVSIELLEQLKHMGGSLVAPPIRISVDVERAAARGQSMAEYNPRSKMAEDYVTLTEWMVTTLAERIEQQPQQPH